ncbi:MAG: sulfur carrier protein ThiS [Opitutaceae bacterium]|nr:sulfur carrier protein ThiS [Opitutaceae bacterium]
MSDRPSIRVRINDKEREVSHDATVALLLEELGLAGKRGIAVAIGEEVIPRSRWPERRLAAEERLIVIQATQGG